MKIRTTITLAVVVILIINGVLAGYFREKMISAENERDEAVVVATDQMGKTVHYINLYNQEVAKSQALEISEGNWKRLKETDGLKFLKQIGGLRKDYKNLEEAASFGVGFNLGMVEITPFEVTQEDGIIGISKCPPLFKWEYKDAYNDLYAIVTDTPKLDIRVPIETALYWERKHRFLGIRFGKKEWTREATSPNKLVKIDSLTVFIRRKK